MQATRRLRGFLKPYWLWAVLAPLLMALEVSMDLMQPRLLQRVIDQGIARSDITLVLHTGIWMAVAALVGLGGGAGCTVYAVLAAQGFGADLRSALFTKVQNLSFGNLDKLETGKLITRLTNDVTQVQEMAIKGLATVGTIASFINYTRQFGRPLNDIADLYNAIQAAVAGAERVFEVIDEVPELTDAPDAVALGQIRGDVVFDDVSFAYDPDTPVLKHVSFQARPGQIVALVGPTGAGKTTIVNLLTRFYDIDSGRITIDGHDIRHVKKDNLRRQLGIVLQDTFLFSGSVMDNIRYGRLDATDAEVIAATHLSNADQFIHRLPQGYATLLSERASNLSQGQRQLLAIARAILADPSILILDEATSSVDTRTEQHIQEAMLRLMAGRTSFVIAHRLSTIRDADQILVINHGEVVEQGKHEELLARGGFYHHLYTSQFRGNAKWNGSEEPAPQARAGRGELVDSVFG